MKVIQETAIDVSLLARVHGEFVEMPGVCLTVAQGARLWNIDRETCAQVLETLVDASFLRRVSDCYVRADCERRCA